MKREAATLTLVAAWVLPTPALATGVVQASRVPNGSIAVDGRATEPAWNSAHWYNDFVQRDPRDGAAPSQDTRIAVVYDSTALYVFVRAFDTEPLLISGSLTRRDRASPSDWIEVWLAPQPGRRSGYRFAVNAAGVQVDARLGDGGEAQDLEWNGVWWAAVQRDPLGWAAEFKIPLSEIRVDAASPWGINVSRRIRRLNEESVLSPTPKMSARVLPYTATLTGVDGTTTRVPVSILPFGVLAWAQKGQAGSPEFRAGGEVRVGLGSASSIEAAVLPDFGQVESDPSQLNLTAFEVFLPEHRPFFLEGRDTFRFPLALRNWANETLFYSRRIGQKPGRDLGLDDTASVDYPNNSRILGAGKWIGRTQEGLNYAVLSALTADEHATVTQGGRTSTPRVAPVTSYNVARLRQDLDGGRSAVGLMATHVERAVSSEDRPYFNTRATALATDFDWRKGNAGLAGHLLGTRIEGSAESINAIQTSSTHYMQRPDAGHLHYDSQRSVLGGWGGEVTGGKFDGTPIRAGVGVRVRSPGLNPNDLGYMQRADTQFAEGWFDWHLDRPTPVYRALSFGVSTWVTKTFGPEFTGQGTSLWGTVRLRNNTSVWVWSSRTIEALDVSLLRGGPGFLVPGSWNASFGFQSDDRKGADFGLSSYLNWRDHDSLKKFGTTLTLRSRPISAISISLAPYFERSLDQLQYVNGDDPQRIIMGRLLRTTGSLTLRADWALTSNLSFESYAMPYVSAGTYTNFYAVSNPRAPHYAERLMSTAYDGDDRFTSAQVRSNLVFRWDYMPGSSAYLVWAHEQTLDHNTVGRFSPFMDTYDLLHAKSYDTLMVKVQYLERF